MGVAVATLIVLAALAVALWLAYTALTRVRQLRTELDQTQSQLNAMRQELDGLKAAAEVLPAAPPPLPRTRSSGLDDLREQLRAAHREESPEE